MSVAGRHALLIGVNRYPNFGSRQQLLGCVNDVEAMAALLRSSYRFEDVVTLRDEEATRDGILAALEDLAARLLEDDVVVVHYSGHGSQMTDREGDEPDGKDETIVPHDSGRAPDPNRDITDDELYAWIKGVTSKTANVTLVFDCCHSGTITRDVFGSRSRWVEADERLASELPPSSVPAAAAGAARDTGPSDWLPMGKYVLIAGCQDDESSYEHAAADDGSVIEHGALTYFLTQELAKAIPGMTYRDLFERVRTRVSAAQPRQHPQLEGTTDRELFGVRDFAPMRFVAVTGREGTTVTLAAGAAHGVVVGSEWDVYAAGTKQIGDGIQPIGRIRATAVRPVEADAELLSEAGEGSIAPDARAVEAARPLTARRLRVAIEVSAEHESRAQELHAGLERSVLAAPAEAGTPPDLQAYVIAPRAASAQPVPQLGAVDQASWAVVGRDGRLAMPVHPVDEKGVIDLLVENFEKLAKYRNGLALANDAPDSDLRGRVKLQLQTRAPDGSWQRVQAGEEGRIILHEGDQFRLEVVNHDDVPVYAAVLDFGVTGRIDLLYPFNGASEPIEPGRSLVLGERETFTLTFPEEFPFVHDPVEPEPVEGHETFKVFAVTGKPVAFDWLRQEAVRGAALEERAALEEVAREALGDRSRDVAAARPMSAELEDWTTVELPFVLRRTDPDGDHPLNPTPQRVQPVAPGAGLASNTSQAPLDDEEPRQRGGAVLFDAKFARDAAFTLIFVAVLLLWPLWIISARVVFGDSPAASFSELIAIQLVIVGVAVAFGGLYLTLLEFRGRASAAAIASETEEGGRRGLGTEAIKATPEILKAFGQLKPVAALLVIAALLFLCATVLAWRGL
jgi:Caspase domain